MRGFSIYKNDYFKFMTTRFIGKLQPCTSRAPEIPAVQYNKGGDDFRCPNLRQTSSFGRQILSGTKARSRGAVPFQIASRFGKADTVGPGPATMAPTSGLNRQIISRRRSAGSVSFGTSTRASSLKTYAIYTTKK